VILLGPAETQNLRAEGMIALASLQLALTEHIEEMFSFADDELMN